MKEPKANPFNGITLHRVADTVFIPLPRLAHEPIRGGCQCDHCKAHPDQPPMWDTIALSSDAKRTWTVHYPELQGE